MNKPSSLRPVRRRSIEDEVYARIRQAILAGEIAGGERLVHEELASRFGTSRIPVRDALKRLVFDGLVEADARGICRAARFGLDDIEEIYALRGMLESHAVERAASRLGDADLDMLERMQVEIEAAAAEGDKERYVALNRDFHRALYDHAGRPRLARIIHGLWQGLPPLTPMALDDRLAAAAAEHRGVLEALRARDAAVAGRAMRAHIDTAGRALCAYVEAQDERIR